MEWEKVARSVEDRVVNWNRETVRRYGVARGLESAVFYIPCSARNLARIRRARWRAA
jgi:hypothetical protein